MNHLVGPGTAVSAAPSETSDTTALVPPSVSTNKRASIITSSNKIDDTSTKRNISMVSKNKVSTATATAISTSENRSKDRCDIEGCTSNFQLYNCRNNRNGCQKYVHHLSCGTKNKHFQDPSNEIDIFCSIALAVIINKNLLE